MKSKVVERKEVRFFCIGKKEETPHTMTFYASGKILYKCLHCGLVTEMKA
jgi:hypothetical protein